MVALAGREHSRHPTPRRVQGRQNLLPRRTLGGIRQGTTRTLAGRTVEGAEKGIGEEASKLWDEKPFIAKGILR
jgi:hypothetical protein